MTNETPKPKAYSYIRFSSPEQSKGDSYRRQTEKAEAYAAIHGLNLDQQSYKDLGVSAFRGINAKTGALGAFLRAVQDGTILEGSYLLVESLDRLTRSDILPAQSLFTQIILAGITIVTLMDNRVYSKQSVTDNPTELVVSILIMMRGNEESTTKGRRIAEVNDKKRRDAANGQSDKPFTRMLPAWLRWDDEAKRHKLIPERAAVVRDIFKKADSGWGQHRIAHWLNQKEEPTWGGEKRKAKYWHRSYVRKLLGNSAVIGTFTPHKLHSEASGKRREPLEAIENYFPAVVKRDVFERVAGKFTTTAARGRNAGKGAMSLVAGLAKCPKCHGTVTRVTKGEHVYLVCAKANARAKGCAYQAVRYRDVEAALTGNAKAIFKDAPRGKSTKDIEKEIAEAAHVLEERMEAASDIASELMSNKSDTLRRKLAEAEADIQGARGRLRGLRERRDTLSGPVVVKRLNTMRDLLLTKPLNIAEANQALKEAVEYIVIDPEAAELRLKWRHAETTEDISFYSRHITTFD